MTDPLTRIRECLKTGRLDEAVHLLDSMSRSGPKQADTLVLRAHVAIAQRREEDAVEWLRRAARSAPLRLDVQYDVGVGYLELGRVHEAIRRFEVAVGLDPTCVDSLLQLGLVHSDRRKQPSIAAEMFRRALEIDPNRIEAFYGLAKALFQLGDTDEAVSLFRQARALAETTGRLDSVALCLQSIAVAIPGAPSANLDEILATRTEWIATHESTRNAVARSSASLGDFPNRDRSPGRPLVVGYVSSFFDRENWMKPVWGLLNQHDRDQFQVRIFSFGSLPGGENPGSATDSAWRPHESDKVFDVASLTNQALAQVIADECVDLLVDLNGYSDPSRLGLFMLRPTPLVVGWFNMYATTGMPCYDCLVGDRHVVLPDEEVHYSEPIARVPGSYLTFRVEYPVPDAVDPPSDYSGQMTLGSLASRYKMTPDVIDAWSEILRRAPKSRLLLRNAGLEAECERQYLLAAFERREIEPSRIELLGRAPHFEFLETYGRIDIALDTFPYNGGTTTTEAIWQGVPVVAFAGETWAGRTSATILREANLDEWLAEDRESYVELAVRWANDANAPRALTDLRRAMRNRLRKSSVCDTPAFAQAMESIYRELWFKWCRGARSHAQDNSSPGSGGTA